MEPKGFIPVDWDAIEKELCTLAHVAQCSEPLLPMFYWPPVHEAVRRILAVLPEDVALADCGPDERLFLRRTKRTIAGICRQYLLDDCPDHDDQLGWEGWPAGGIDDDDIEQLFMLAERLGGPGVRFDVVSFSPREVTVFKGDQEEESTWYSTDPSERPAEYKEEWSIEGTSGQLTKWVTDKERGSLEARVRDKTIWVFRIDRTHWRVYFREEAPYRLVAKRSTRKNL